ncbi:hypothetical protein ACQEVF_01845 [Nonomuraea polychroma]|uniref:hypothetical protein n=1 Tax=Nonomuraea polychroma TaxID=46176 RepID=UPI003D93FE15
MTLVTIVTLVTVLVLWSSGLVSARLGVHGVEGSFRSSNSATRTVSIRFGIKNNGWTPVTIVGAGRSSSFMRLLRIEDMRTPMTLNPGETTAINFVYQVTDCANITIEEWPIPVRVERLWGTQTIYVDPSPQEPNTSNDSVPEDFEGSSWTLWHVAMASDVCDW